MCTCILNTCAVGDDYQQSTATFIFNSGDPTPCLDIPIINDQLQESCETFGVIVTESPLPGANLILLPATATVTINDDEGMHYLTNAKDSVYYILLLNNLSRFLN